MNNYQQNGFDPNNQTIYPNQPNGGIPPKKNNNNLLIIVLVSLVAVLLIVVAVLAFNSGKNQRRNVYVPTNSTVQDATGVESQSNPVNTDSSNKNNVQNNNNGNDVANESASSSSETATSPVVPSGNYSRKNPAPVGVEQVLDYKDDYDDERNFKVSVKITETLRGEAAFTKLKEAYKYTDPADAGYEYVLAKVSMKLLSMNTDKAFEANSYDFTAFSSTNEEIENAYASAPDPRLDGKLYEGASTEGWIVLQVKADDVSPKVAYKINYDGSGGLWFALQ